MALAQRYRENIVTAFDVFCELAAPNEGGDAVVLTKYPEDYDDQGVLNGVRQFAFPTRGAEDASDAVQLFSFVLTDSASKYTFGFCRYTPRNKTCIVMLSGYQWPNVFYNILNHLANVMNNGNQSDMDSLLTRVYHTDVPPAGEQMHFETATGGHRLSVEVPDVWKLPSLRDDKFMLEFYNAVTPKQMIAIYASLLKERRILFVGRRPSQLSSCVYGAASLMYPMNWQHVFIPVLPTSLREMILAPMPFIIGTPKQAVDDNALRDVGDVLIVDLEEKTLLGSFDDAATMPEPVLSFLRGQLRSASSDMGDGLSRAFLRANCHLFGGYRMGYVRDESTGVIRWDKNKFVSEQRGSFQPFLSSLLGSEGVQYLERFISERVRLVNENRGFSDEFERELLHMDLKIKGQMHPEALQQAVLSVRDNASDVIGALKDRVQSIQIRDKLGKLATPAQSLRRPKKSGGGGGGGGGGGKERRERKEKPAVVPMSFNNVLTTDSQFGGQYDDDSSCSDDIQPEPLPTLATVKSAPAVADLIDLSDTPPTSLSLAAPTHAPPPVTAFFDPFSPVSSNSLTQSQSVSQPPTVDSFLPGPSTGLYTNPFYTQPSPGANAPPSKAPPTWERFD